MSINIEIHHIEAALDIKAGYTLGLADAMLIHAMARKLLATIEATPVAWASSVSIERGDVCEVWPNGEQDKAGNLSIAPLFTAPPAPAVPDERHPVGGDKWGWSGEYNRGWNACRAAMLENTPKATSGMAPAFNIGNMQNTPAGFKLVPVELLSTVSMLIDLCRTHTTLNGGGTYNQRVLSDCETTMNAIAILLAAAPTPTK